ncbi:hypothetical protein GGG16DRAFT_127571 [Schizophyllum commune]
MASRPPSPPFLSGRSFPAPFERFLREPDVSDWASAFTLLDTIETYFDSHVDLWQRKLQAQSERLKLKAEETFKIRDLSAGDLLKTRIRDLRERSSEGLAVDFDKEMKNFKLKIQQRMTRLSASWHSTKVVRTREKVSFFVGVMTVLFSALMFGMAPQYVPLAYTIGSAYLIPLRWYKYKQRAWHYFLFDLCYYVTILNFIFLWLAPWSPALFVACYCLSHGSLGSAVITWRNSLVFHDQDKVTSLFIHIYGPFTFTVIRHFYPGAEERYPALKELPHLHPIKAILLSGGIYLIWQVLYWKLVLIDRREKIESGQRTTSFSYFLNDRRSAIGRALANVPQAYRELAFMGGQLLYTIITILPAIWPLYDSPRWSGAFLIMIFAVSVWNGGGYYIEVFGRKFERELEALRKELAESSASSHSSGSTRGDSDDDEMASYNGSTVSTPAVQAMDLPPTKSEPVISNGQTTATEALNAAVQRPSAATIKMAGGNLSEPTLGTSTPPLTERPANNVHAADETRAKVE